MTADIARVSQAKRALELVETPAEAKVLYDQLEALSQYARRYRLDHDKQNEIAETKLRTARKGGQILAATVHPGGSPLSREGTLPEGFSRNQSSRWQALASLSDEDFEAHLTAVREHDEELTLASALRVAKEQTRQADIVELRRNPTVLPTGVFSTIVADPPWQYDNKATRGAAEDHYPTMSVEELCALPVEDWAAPESHLYLWTTNGFLRDAFDVLDEWGFTYKTTLVWAKPQIGMGNYFRSSTEYVLFGVRGGMRTLDCNQRNWFEAKRGRHSKKPGVFFDIVHKASLPPYLEMFVRERRLDEGWDYWGNEA